MIEIDFIAGSKSSPTSTKSYDAIAIRFKEAVDAEPIIIVIDAGFSDIGNDIVNHLWEHYQTDKVDLMISTHPDNDHLNGLITAIQQLEVKELLVHQPDNHRSDLTGFTNLDNLQTLLAFAAERGVIISEPFTGETRFNDRVVVLGPTQDYYKALLDEQLDPAVQAAFAKTSLPRSLASIFGSLLDRAVDYLPVETLGNNGVTHPRNNSSVITLLNVGGRRYMLTGDAGIPALEAAADEYESNFGSFAQAPLTFFQAPHHGSKRNVGTDILNRILGEPNASFNPNLHGFIHAAKASRKHPSPKVTNALLRRGCKQDCLAVTNGDGKRHHHGAPEREGWSTIAPYPIYEEDDES